MRALLFGSIGAVVETSELQRAAFNAAFRAHGVPIQWDREGYISLLATSGGRNRIASEAEKAGVTVDADQIHRTKTERFHEALRTEGLSVRRGVSESLRAAKELDVRTAFVSTTNPATIDLLFEHVSGVSRDDFDVVSSSQDGYRQKPSPDAYVQVLNRLRVAAEDAVAVEDNAPGLQAASAAGVPTIAFLGENTSGQDASGSDWTASRDVFPVVLGALTAARSRAA